MEDALNRAYGGTKWFIRVDPFEMRIAMVCSRGTDVVRGSVPSGWNRIKQLEALALESERMFDLLPSGLEVAGVQD